MTDCSVICWQWQSTWFLRGLRVDQTSYFITSARAQRLLLYHWALVSVLPETVPSSTSVRPQAQDSPRRC